MNSRILLLAAVVLSGSVSPAQTQGTRPPMTHGGAPAVSPDGSKIAFLSDRDGANDIYVIGSDVTGEARLTNTPEDEGQLRLIRRRQGASVHRLRERREPHLLDRSDGQEPEALGTVPAGPENLS
jgi:hypothetical protein